MTPKAPRRCPTCKRILFPTRTGNWPPHRNTNTLDRRWCIRTDQPVEASA